MIIINEITVTLKPPYLNTTTWIGKCALYSYRAPKTRYYLTIYIYIYISILILYLKRYFQLNMYNPTDKEISLKVYKMHLYYDHTLYRFPLYTLLRPADGPKWPKHVVVIILNRIQDSCVLTYPTPSLRALIYLYCYNYPSFWARRMIRKWWKFVLRYSEIACVIEFLSHIRMK